jgi:hypothetical protein
MYLPWEAMKILEIQMMTTSLSPVPSLKELYKTMLTSGFHRDSVT